MTSAPLAAAEGERLRAWVRACLDRPGELPADVEPVQTRLVRAVGVGALADGVRVYLKTMGFPRRRDRLRYWLRRLPALHESEVLNRAARAGVPCPRVLAAEGRRRGLHWPEASVLATAALDVVASPPPGLQECAALARRLVDVGIVHRDLHEGNFVRLRDGTCAVLDLQSARCARGPVAVVPLAARLLAADWPTLERARAVVDGGLLSADELPAALRAAQGLRRAAVRRRVTRCWLTSTEFQVCRGWPWALVQRRRLPAAGAWISVGREAAALWTGARYLEVVCPKPVPSPAMAGEEGGVAGPLGTGEVAPPLAAVSLSGWRWQHGAVYLTPGAARAGWPELRARCLAGFARYRGELRGPRPAALDPEAVLPWTGPPTAES